MSFFVLISWVILIFYCILGFFFVFGDNGLISYHKIKNKQEQLTKQIKEQRDGKNLLQVKLQNLKNFGEYYKYEIKNKLLYIDDKDVIILFPKKKGKK